MKYLVTANSDIWKNSSPVLAEHGNDVIFICFENSVNTDSEFSYGKTISCPASAEQKTFSKAWTDSQQFKALQARKEELLEFIGNEDTVVLADIRAASLYPYKLLQSSAEFQGDLHLIGLPPFRFQSVREKIAFLQMVQDLSNTRSAAFLDSDEYMDQLIMKLWRRFSFAELMKEVYETLCGILKRLETSDWPDKEKVWLYDSEEDRYSEAAELVYTCKIKNESYPLPGNSGF